MDLAALGKVAGLGGIAIGNALARLDERESGPAHLQEAVAAYRAALEEKQSIPSLCTWRPCASALWCQRSISFTLMVCPGTGGRPQCSSDRGSIRVPIPHSDLLRDHGGEGFP